MRIEHEQSQKGLQQRRPSSRYSAAPRAIGRGVKLDGGPLHGDTRTRGQTNTYEYPMLPRRCRRAKAVRGRGEGIKVV
ncbi:hypothetical protein TgHK011_003831 [Trichoderma gracile]|nr:hypothetical protein TgHK011_003831 [Trichoderma gracile]